MSIPKPLTEVDRAFLKATEERLWVRRESYHRVDGHRVRYDPQQVTIGEGDWGRIRKLIEDHDLPVSLSNASFCFGICLNIYDHATPPDSPRNICSVSGEHLPGYDDKKRNDFEYGWAAFEPIAKRARNAELLDFYEMPPIEEKSRYAY